MSKPDVGRVVEIEQETRMRNFLEMGCPSRAEAAETLLRWMPNWYSQTPEGQYLQWVAADEKANG